MKTRNRNLLLLSGMVALAIVVGACSDDDNDGGPSGDTTAPVVVSVDPGNGENRVGLSEQIVVLFNEAMDPTTAAANVALTSGAVTNTAWSNGNQTLTISHSAWAEGAQVTVTLNTGLADAAGNGLAQASNTTFWTTSSTPMLLQANPENGATDVPLNAQLQLYFSGAMNLTSLESAITLSDVAPAKTDFPFTVSDGEEDWVIVEPTDDLPASTVIHVTISTDAEYVDGTNLAAPIAFSFTTGTEVDTTPPTITSFEPVSGGTIPADTPFFRVHFSEPVNPETVQPIAMGAQFMLALFGEGGEPTFNDDFTILTVPVTGDLPAGVRLFVTFGGYEDLNGVEQPAETTWTATVAGTPDAYPVEDGLRFIFLEIWQEGPIGGEPTDSGDDLVYIQLDTQPGNIFYRAEYDPSYTVTVDGEIYQRTGSEILILGFYDEDPGAQNPVEFDEPLTWLPLPPAGTWGGETTATVDEELFTLTATGQLMERTDRLYGPDRQSGPAYYWTDAWRVRIEVEITVEIDEVIETVIEETQEIWYAPGYGIVEYLWESTEYQEEMEFRAEGFVYEEGLN